MAISIGGSPSTGSSLLRQMLNRHPAIYCGPETNLFAFPTLFEDWSKYKHNLIGSRVIGSKLTSPVIRLINETRLVGTEQSWTRAELKGLVAQSETFKTFCTDYFARPCQVYGKQVWAEKTPANVITFRQFLTTWNSSIVVHITRHPADTIASLLDRGIPLFEAAARYLLNCAFALKYMHHTRYSTLKYEGLVSDPERALTPLLKKLSLDYNPAMAGEGNPSMEETAQLSGWRYGETERPQPGSLDRFSQASEELQEAILTAIQAMQINPLFAQKAGLSVLTIPECVEKMGYKTLEMQLERKIVFHDQLRRQEKTYRRKRVLKRNWWFEKSKPISIADI